MMIDGAVIREQGVTFAVVVVKRYVVDSRFQADDMIDQLSSVFPGMPVVLMAQDHRGVPKYYGRSDIARFMANVPLRAIPWKRYSVTLRTTI
jgi:hypothetical protein